MRSRLRLYFVFCLVCAGLACTSLQVWGQNEDLYLPLQQEYLRPYESHLYRKNAEIRHTAVKPYRRATVRQAIPEGDSVYFFEEIDLLDRPKWLNYLLDNGLNSHLFRARKPGKYDVSLDPLFVGMLGRETADGELLFASSRGLRIQGSVGKLSFETAFSEADVRQPRYIDRFVDSLQALPGLGFPKTSGPNSERYNYSWATGYIAFSPSEHFSFQFGHGENFIGDGYRSLLLSDNSFNYPFLRITTRFWRIEYTNLFTQFNTIDRGANFNFGGGYPKKNGSFHYLSLAVSERVQIGLFEGVIWQTTDSLGNARGFELDYFNPVIFYRPVEFSLGSPDNVLLGLNLRVTVGRNSHLYGQMLLDDINLGEMSSNPGFVQQKVAFQLGAKAYDAFGVEGLFLRGEYNRVRPYTYAHKDSMQNYTHQNQALAHPQGANFDEGVFEAEWRKGRFLLRNRLTVARYGADRENEHNGKDLSRSDFSIPEGVTSAGHFLLDGLRTDVLYNDLEASLLVNPVNNFKIKLNWIVRWQSDADGRTLNNQILTLSFVTDLHNYYNDF